MDSRCPAYNHLAGADAPATTSGLRLQLPSLARLRVVTLPTQILHQASALHLLLELLERPIEAVVLIQMYFDHVHLPGK